MEAMKNLLERRSVRKYETKQVPDDLLDQVLEAGLYAPTGMNTQNIYMVAVRDKETRDQMMRMNAAHAVGLGSCWIHRAKQVFESPEGKALLRRWGLSEDLVGVGNCILGNADEDPAPKPRKEGRIVKIG